MTDAAREARNAYQRKWNAANKEKRREYMQRYWERKTAQNVKKCEKTGKDLPRC